MCAHTQTHTHMSVNLNINIPCDFLGVHHRRLVWNNKNTSRQIMLSADRARRRLHTHTRSNGRLSIGKYLTPKNRTLSQWFEIKSHFSCGSFVWQLLQHESSCRETTFTMSVFCYFHEWRSRSWKQWKQDQWMGDSVDFCHEDEIEIIKEMSTSRSGLSSLLSVCIAPSTGKHTVSWWMQLLLCRLLWEETRSCLRLFSTLKFTKSDKNYIWCSHCLVEFHFYTI